MCGCRHHSDRSAPCTCKCDSCGLGVAVKTRRFWQGGKSRTVIESVTVDDRPHVLLDPEDRETVRRLWDSYVKQTPWQGDANDLQAALRSLIAPPRPEEPTGLGAVVEVASGELYIRPKTTSTNRHWKRARGEECSKRHTWDELQVVRILNDGYEVQP